MRRFIKHFVSVFSMVVFSCALANAALACATNEIDVLGDGTQCETSKFEVTTTNLAADTTFLFSMSAKGTFYVDWGDGSAVQTIDRGNTSVADYTHTYETAGVYTIKFGSSNITGYNTDFNTTAFGFYKASGGAQDKIAAISGSLPALLPKLSASGQPRLYNTFREATNLTDIPAGLFSGYTGGVRNMFLGTFYGCTGLTSIPATLFSGITNGAQSMFASTFYGCTGLTSIPATLFNGITNGAQSMFASTFYGCTGLSTVPEELFSDITTVSGTGLFRSTFSNCTGLTSVPAGLFGGFTTGKDYMFSNTFKGCTSLTTVPMELFSNFTSGGQYMFEYTFAESGLTSIPEGLFDGITTVEYRMFMYTFSDCADLRRIPDGLFSNVTTGAEYAFWGTFGGCSSLTSIPEDLFSGLTTGVSYMFQWTFARCTGLTALPEHLFSNITTAATYMFRSTFEDCSNISGYIPPTLFAGLIANNSPTANYMWDGAWSGTKLVTQCPAGATQYVTKYEGSGTNKWMGKVSCEPCPGTLPEHTSYTTAGTCDWTCDSGYLNTGTSCETAKFSVTTTTLEADETVSFSISAAGEFYVDCGVDGVLSGTGVSGNVITRADTTNNTYTCTYSTGGDKTISFAGVASAYSTTDNVAAISFYSSSNGTQAKIAAISGSLGALFPTIGDGGDGNQPRFFETFRGASNFVGPIPANLFSGVTGAPVSRMFNGTFRSTGLQTAIPSGLFAGLDGAPTNELFANTWRNCLNMTGPIPADLFAGIHGAPATKMFFGTFATNASDSGEGYSGETGSITGSIPSNLFAGISGAPATSMFHETFCGQGKLTGTIPENLFAGVSGAPASSMFAFTFCGTSLSGAIPEDLFAGVSGTPAASMFLSTFKYCAGLTGSIPEDLFAGISGAPASGMFRHTFYACSGLTGSIPGGLFAGLQGVPKGSMFQQTFARCSNLTGAIPANLFAGISGAPATWMFAGTFQNCSKLSGELPAELFAGISGAPKSQMFNSTFAGCSSLSGYIPPTFFAGISTETTLDDQMTNVFNNSGLDTECPDGMTQYMTGFEDFFTGKVSCEIVCDNGYHSDNNMCVANTINIYWSDVDDNGTATVMNTDVLYNGDIVTPVKAMNYPGKIFRGWLFNKPEEEGGE